MSDKLFALDPAVAGVALATFGATSGPTLTIDGATFAQGMEGALCASELLAAEAGVVPYVVLDDGSKGVVSVGAARDVIMDPLRWRGAPRSLSASQVRALQTLYLAAHGSARQAHGSSRIVGQSPSQPGIGIVPVVPLLVLGVAAIIAAASYATITRQTQIQCDADNARSAAAVKAATDISMAALAAGQPIPESIAATFVTAAHTESHVIDWKPWLLGGGALVAVGAAAYLGVPKLLARALA